MQLLKDFSSIYFQSERIKALCKSQSPEMQSLLLIKGEHLKNVNYGGETGKGITACVNLARQAKPKLLTFLICSDRFGGVE